MPPVRTREIVARAGRPVPVCRLWAPDVGDGWDDLSGFPDAVADVVSRDVVVDESEDGDRKSVV